MSQNSESYKNCCQNSFEGCPKCHTDFSKKVFYELIKVAGAFIVALNLWEQIYVAIYPAMAKLKLHQAKYRLWIVIRIS